MANTLWRRSGSFEFDANGERAGGAKAYFYEGGTTTAYTVYRDANQTTAHDIPLVANGVGRWPAVYIPFIATFDELVKTSAGSQLTYYTEIPNADPTTTATPDALGPESLQTGDWKFSDVDETKDGFVRANGRSIGSGDSLATERAHADCEDLFTYRWNKLGNSQAAVSGGRGASAAIDWAANKTIALPDCRGGYPIGLDTMGNSAGSLFLSTPFTNGGATTPGSLCGLNTHTLTTAQLPTVTPAGTNGYAGNFTPAGTNAYAANFTPAGTNAYAANFTPAGTNAYAANFTPAGTVTKPTITVTDTRVWSASKAGSNAGTTGSTDAILQPNGTNTTLTIAVTVASGAISAALDSTPTFTGSSVALPVSTFTGTPAALPASTFTGDSVALPASTFTGTPAALPASTFTGTPFGSGDVHNNVSRAILGSWYVKL